MKKMIVFLMVFLVVLSAGVYAKTLMSENFKMQGTEGYDEVKGNGRIYVSGTTNFKSGGSQVVGAVVAGDAPAWAQQVWQAFTSKAYIRVYKLPALETDSYEAWMYDYESGESKSLGLMRTITNWRKGTVTAFKSWQERNDWSEYDDLYVTNAATGQVVAYGNSMPGGGLPDGAACIKDSQCASGTCSDVLNICV